MDMEEDFPDRPLLVFDGDCSFCKALVDYGKRITGERVEYAPYQEVGPRFPRIAPEDFASSVKLILPGGEVRSGAHAVFSALERTPGKGLDARAVHPHPGCRADLGDGLPRGRPPSVAGVSSDQAFVGNPSRTGG